LIILAPAANAADEPVAKRQQDVVYGRKFGTALTMDVFRPTGKANGAAVVWVVSGGWFSTHEFINPGMVHELCRRGYTVFAVVHGSQPKFTIPEILEDMHRAVRFIRYHAKDYGIDPERIGITGGSAGGHLSLMQGTASKEGDPKAKDPVDRVSSRVQAVACFFPPTDFLNWGERGKNVLEKMPEQIKPAFAFRERNPKTGGFRRVTDVAKIIALLRELSPIQHVTADDAPTLIVHGDKDKLVPIQQAEVLIAKLKKAGVPAELAVKKGADHGWKGMDKDLVRFADWFDRHLPKKGEDKSKPEK
jgi:acetyl esterase/lipase